MSVSAILPLLLGRGLVGDKRIAIQGQSNAVGTGDRVELSQVPVVTLDAGLATLDAGTFARVWVWNSTAGAYQQLQIGANNLATASTTLGAEFGLAVRWMRETTAGNLFIDKQAVSGQLIAYFQSGGSFFATSVTRKAAADDWLAANGYAPEHAGWLWVQGEGDYLGTAAYYEGALNALISSRITSGLQPAAATNVVAMQLSGTNGYGAGVEAAQYAVGATNQTVKLVRYPNNFEGDALHLNARGQTNLGYLAFSAFFSRHFLAV